MISAILNPVHNKFNPTTLIRFQKNPHQIEVMIINPYPITRFSKYNFNNNLVQNPHLKCNLTNVKIIHVQKSWYIDLEMLWTNSTLSKPDAFEIQASLPLDYKPKWCLKSYKVNLITWLWKMHSIPLVDTLRLQ